MVVDHGPDGFCSSPPADVGKAMAVAALYQMRPKAKCIVVVGLRVCCLLNLARLASVAVTVPTGAPIFLLLLLLLLFLVTFTIAAAAAAVQALSRTDAVKDFGSSVATWRDSAIGLAIHFDDGIQHQLRMMIAAAVIVSHHVLQLRRYKETMSFEQALQLFGL